MLTTYSAIRATISGAGLYLLILVWLMISVSNCVVAMVSRHVSNDLFFEDDMSEVYGRYSGEVDNEGRRHGQGKMRWEAGELEGMTYEGEWVEDNAEGKGKMYYAAPEEEKPILVLAYEGQFQFNKPHGQGKLFYQSGAVAYEGELKRGLRDGDGISYYEDDGRVQFYGQWREDQMLVQGEGKIYEEDGTVYESYAGSDSPEGLSIDGDVKDDYDDF